MPDFQLGFTGTQKGMNKYQRISIINLLSDLIGRQIVEPYSGDYLHNVVLHHGDCIGADQEIHSLATTQLCKVCIHPPDKDVKRAFCENYDHIEEPQPYLYRNRAIVNHSIMLWATPRSMHEELRSGTWSTIRYAATKEISTVIFWPNGHIAKFAKGYGRAG